MKRWTIVTFVSLSLIVGAPRKSEAVLCADLGWCAPKPRDIESCYYDPECLAFIFAAAGGCAVIMFGYNEVTCEKVRPCLVNSYGEREEFDSTLRITFEGDAICNRADYIEVNVELLTPDGWSVGAATNTCSYESSCIAEGVFESDRCGSSPQYEILSNAMRDHEDKSRGADMKLVTGSLC